jgi:hypothetical protein
MGLDGPIERLAPAGDELAGVIGRWISHALIRQCHAGPSGAASRNAGQ